VLQGVGAHGFSTWAKSSKLCDHRAGNSTAPPGKLYAISSEGADVRRLVDAAPATANNNLQRKKRDITDRKGDHSASGARPTRKPDSATYCESVKLKGACHAAGGPHWRVQEASHYGNSQQRGRKWHPPIGMHLLRAEMLVYTYTQIVLDAIYMVEDALHKAQEAAKVEVKPVKKGWGRLKKTPKALEGYPVAARALLTGLQTLIFCALVATNLNTHRYCLFLSTEVRAQLVVLQTPVPSEPLHCATEECAALPQCYTDFLPNYNPTHLLSSIVVGTHMGWYQEAANMNDLGPEFGILDKKFYFKVRFRKISLQGTFFNSNMLYLCSCETVGRLKERVAPAAHQCTHKRCGAIVPSLQEGTAG